MERKSLKDISWVCSEEEYRADPALSYSTIAKYERGGFESLEHLFDKVESPSLVLGSAVDAWITGGRKEFEERFIIAEYPAVPDSMLSIIKSLFETHRDMYKSLTEIPDRDIIYTAEQYKYQPNWKPETRAKVIKEKGDSYYSLLYISEDKTILDIATYKDVCNMVEALKNSEATRWYFQDDNPFDNHIERLYQLKFKGEHDGVNYRNMADLIVVDHNKKVVIPVDLKTSFKKEYDFYKSFLEWKYFHQARLYWRIIRQNMDKDEYFKDFELLDYRFIVVNKVSLNPLVWVYPDTTLKGTIYYGNNNNIEVRDPYEVGKELDFYLKNNSTVPVGITTEENDISEWLNKL